MSPKPYLAVSGFIFFVVGLAHLSRLLNHWPVQVGSWALPEWVSFVGLPATWGLCIWAFMLRRR